MRFYRGVEGRQDMPDYLNTEPNPQKPGAAEAIERLQVALRHLRAAKLALTDLSYAPACEGIQSVEHLDYARVNCLDDANDLISYVAGMIDTLGGKPDMDSHYSGREQAEAFTAVLKRMAGQRGYFSDMQDWMKARDELRQMEQMARRMA